MSVIRFGVSLEADLMEALDKYVTDNKYSNRSQALRQLINKHVAEKKWQCNHIVAGAVSLIYDHRKKVIANALVDVQQEYKDVVLSVNRHFLDDNVSLEIIAVKGVAARLTEFSDKLIAVKGIQHGKLTMSRAD